MPCCNGRRLVLNAWNKHDSLRTTDWEAGSHLRKSTSMNALDSSGPADSQSLQIRILAAKAERAEQESEAAKGRARVAKKRFKQARRAFKVAKRAAKRARQEAEDAQKTLAAAPEKIAKPQAKRKIAPKPATPRKRTAIQAKTAGTPRSRPSTSTPTPRPSAKKTTTTRGQPTATSKPKSSKPRPKASKEAAAGTPMPARLHRTTRAENVPAQDEPQKPSGPAPADIPVQVPSEGTVVQISRPEETQASPESEPSLTSDL